MQCVVSKPTGGGKNRILKKLNSRKRGGKINKNHSKQKT